MVNEVICVHVGQAGCQIGSALWQLLCQEHGIRPKGTMDPAKKRTSVASDRPATKLETEDVAWKAFFSEKRNGQMVPRCVMLDTDPSYVAELHASKARDLFPHDDLLAYKQDCKGNFCEGRLHATEFKVLDRLLERIRRMADDADALQGFFAFHSVAGGTGSGVSCELLHSLKDEYGAKSCQTIDCPIYPSPHLSSNVTEPYNSILFTANTLEAADLTLCQDNQNAYKMCCKNLGIKRSTYTQINAILAQTVSLATTSLRYKTQLSASLNELVTNLVPSKPFRYALMALSPVCSPKSERAKKGFTIGQEGDILRDLFQGSNILCESGHTLRMNRFLSAAILVRGRMPKTGAPVSKGDIHNGCESLMKRKTLNFLPWQNSGAWKIGATANPPVIPDQLKGHIAESPMQAALIGNSTAIRSLFMQQYRRYLKLFFNKAYIWQYLESGAELDEFYEARETVRRLIDAYEELLVRAVQVEDPGGRLSVYGRSIHDFSFGGAMRQVQGESQGAGGGHNG